MDTNESKLYLVTERCEDNKHEVNFLYTSDDLFGPGRFLDDPSKLEQAGDPDWRYLLHREKGDETLEWRLHEVDMTGDMKHAAHEIAEFLSGAHNGPEGTWETDDLRVSPAARKMLAELMRPVLNADFGSQQFMYAYHASEWVKQNPEFMNDLDKVYSTLGLFRVERIRFSVTQGEAAVYCNGHKVVQYGDEICMQLKDGNISRGLFRDPEPGVLYGPVIGGYGSIKPDDKFRKAAIAQYDTFVYDYLQRVPVREVEVWQLGRAEGAHEARFLGYDQNIKLNGIFRPELYEQVWKGSVNANTLEDIYYIFNMAHPEGYKAASLSVSDVVKVDGNHYFCDSIGFRKIEFDRTPRSLDDRLQEAKEASAEQAKSSKDKTIDTPDKGR